MRALSASCSWWKRTSLGEVAVTSLTGTLTSPKLTDPLQMDLGMYPFFHMFAVNDTADVNPGPAATAARLAALLTGGGQRMADPSRTDLVFEPSLEVLPLERGTAPPDVWAVDGGQGLVADARCLQVYVTR